MSLSFQDPLPAALVGLPADLLVWNSRFLRTNLVLPDLAHMLTVVLHP